ncbi:hypothetical protein HRR83_007226 [Exophiala dermatitidis]|uniref:ubiquitinyl hydrolase 1 n=2 Tax=Exophiala dermatitidis TaxID=5970 RepID=H6C473_EXODN|nr:ubiquitin carboxyl-terminal hydrolase L5 [Exophiala dermatitidis NIH/UT8656]KAJ4509096.1 hypothetical protein HRR75_006065 [Exophiala dermatitidis]EHY58409.1 ubiquitin carboxyl-terminal hydrolase L5 [Exophiala dermatitidis NIH/UT8656]KAJ4511185.1 hypothetical protein HRR73_006518 [Exophiala dermatitidis]KAJ4511880.1 hypothetical protein HRR74_006614 [Exophiala dermatitidis]KAJ4534738.1 hypothetical protein HRR76_006650 [Exophiala dermatitidis]
MVQTRSAETTVDDDNVIAQPAAEPVPDTASTQATSTVGSSAEDVTPMSTDDAVAAGEQAGSWKGWAILENDPVIFTTLLREWGVPNVQVHEIVPLDSLFDHAPESVYGLIFLSRWTPTDTVNSITEPPHGVWFANQISDFSCATVALMNIINNRMDLDLGHKLNEFRAQTLNMTPKDRGIALDRFDHVRDVHNSFATDIDKMNVDLRLKYDAMAAEKKKKAATTRRPRKRLREDEDLEDDDVGFHFVAYVPAEGAVWKMDGLERLPREVGRLSDGDSWVSMVLPELQAQWESAASGALEFSLLALTAMTDSSSVDKDRAKMERAREDWGPLIAHLLRLHAERGDLREALE